MDNLIDRIRTAKVRAGENEVLKHLDEIGLGDEKKNSAGVVSLSNVVMPPKGWEIDLSTGTPILMFEKCSVIQDEQAYLVMRLLSAEAA